MAGDLTMHVCLICPIPNLVHFIDRGATHHLLLSHLLDDSDSGRAYAAFYRRRAKLGDFVAIDNGAKELGHGLGLDTLFAQAADIGAKEVALTDVRYKSGETIRAGLHQLKWLATDEGAAAYFRAGWPRLMFIPQGDDYNSWKWCFESLLSALQRHPMKPDITVGVAYHYAHLFSPEMYLSMISLVQSYSLETHLLGWTRDLVTLRTASIRFPQLRSMDTSRSFVYGKHGLAQLEGYPGEARKYPGRDTKFFTEGIGASKVPQVVKNIEQLRRMAKDPVGHSRCRCGSEKLRVVDHSDIWHDGDIYCENGHYVRMFDAG